MAKDPYATPAMQQWTRCKQQFPDCILFFRMGDFYELFGPDAESMGRALGLAVVDRGNGIPVAGVPHHQKTTYLQRALEHGFRVAVVDQLQDPKDAKGVVDRGVTQVITPGTLVDESMLRDEQSVTLAAVAFLDDHAVGAAMVELSTGHFEVLDANPGEVIDELARRGVKEILYAEPVAGEAPERVKGLLAALGASGTGRAGWHFRPGEALEAITSLFDVASVEGFGLDEAAASTRAAGAVIRYLRETQAVDRPPGDATSGGEFQRQRVTLAHIRPPRRVERDRACRIDSTSLRALEIEQTIRDGQLAGSLAGVFLASPVGTRCVVRTPMGKRLLRQWLANPSRDAKSIRARHDAVQALVNGRTLAEALGETLKGVSDVARIAGRVALGRANPRDLVCLADSALAAERLVQTLQQAETLGGLRERLEVHAKALTALGRRIKDTLVDDAPGHLREGGAVRDGVDAELDEARGLEKDAGVWLADYQTRLIAEHDLPSLKVGYNSVFGYYIELPAAQARRAPDAFTRKQTLKNAERYITPELKTFEDKVTTASARALDRERTIFDGLCERARQRVPDLVEYAETVSELDVLLGFADKAHQRGWKRPEITTRRELSIHAGRHPVLDETLGQAFVPNDCELGIPDAPANLALITGPNMAGKSTYIRQTALLVVLAQAGSFVPADRAIVGVCDRIFTRVGADDALHRGQSTFMVEMTETANILNNATTDSLVILDEIGRGTSTLDGLSLAWAIAECLAGDDTNPGPRTLFATHYHEITELEEKLAPPPRVRNLPVAVREWTTDDGKQEIVFLHSIRPGKADQSYGVHVAELAGVPRAVTKRAREILGALSVQHARMDTTKVQAPRKSRESAQLGLFTEFLPHPAVDELRELKLDSMTPMQAFDALRRLKGQAQTDL
ncbi:DNA mismatch repair protein MutS [Nodularia spumigena]|uniref:DNA mismatch repair protein MutS n=1 Tax=Nodularia spumigena TaxID=70799 RepID=UPI002B216E19|nr:DNA mismatch repair protein MutS [Nodularia spumigena]MEA5611771.1 DNA mismatch repair protein MutS [Nodularia spumigena UHCC 0040]